MGPRVSCSVYMKMGYGKWEEDVWMRIKAIRGRLLRKALGSSAGGNWGGAESLDTILDILCWAGTTNRSTATSDDGKR